MYIYAIFLQAEDQVGASVGGAQQREAGAGPIPVRLRVFFFKIV